MTGAPLRRLLLAFGLLACGMDALAHQPMARCKAIPGGRVQCTGGFSDGGTAPGVTMDVISYDGEILVSGKLDADSRMVFARPAGAFYVLLEVGPGHAVEIDHSAIAPLGPAAAADRK